MAKSDALSKLLHKLSSCVNYQTLFALESDFLKVGLSLQCTGQNWMTLCKVKKGVPQANNVLDDFIFLAPLTKKFDEVSDKSIGVVIDFVQTNAGAATEIKGCERVWRNGIEIYDKAISIMNEDINHIAQTLFG